MKHLKKYNESDTQDDNFSDGFKNYPIDGLDHPGSLDDWEKSSINKEEPIINNEEEEEEEHDPIGTLVDDFLSLSDEEQDEFLKRIQENKETDMKYIQRIQERYDDFDGDLGPDEESELQELYAQGAEALTRAAEMLGVEDNLDIKEAIEKLRELDTLEAIELIEDIEYIDTEISNLTDNFTDSFEDDVDDDYVGEKKKWIGDALRRPGALRKKLGKKKGEKITLAEIGDQLAKLNRKDKDPKKKGVQLSKKDSRTKKQLNLAKTLKSFKKESLEGDVITYKEYIKEELEEGKEKRNQKLGTVICKNCGYKADGFDFKGVFKKDLKCPKCKSKDLENGKRPNPSPAPQPKK